MAIQNNLFTVVISESITTILGFKDLHFSCSMAIQITQHTFSADLKFTLHLAIPALEKLHAEWTVKSTKPKYSVFHNAIDEALQKVDEYYQKSSNSNSYMFAMGTIPFCCPESRNLISDSS
jgi:hypothetical protein